MPKRPYGIKGMCWCCGHGSFALRVIEMIGWLCPECYDGHKNGQCSRDHRNINLRSTPNTAREPERRRGLTS